MATKNQDTNLRVTQSVLSGFGVPSVQIPELSKSVAAKARALTAAENTQLFSDFIGMMETGRAGPEAYRIGFGGGRIDDLSKHPNISKAFKETTGNTNTTTAAGKHQYLNSTWQGLSAKTGTKDFSPEAQEANFRALLKEKGALASVEAGDFAGAVQKLGKTWASLPTSPHPQGKKTWAEASAVMAKLGGPALATPNYDGKIPYKPSTPVVSEKNVIQAMLPTPQEQMATAAQVEQDRVTGLANTFAQERSLEEQQVAQAAATRKKQIDSMIAGAFDPSGAISGNGAANQERDMLANVTELDDVLSKLIDKA
jgi:muramidase (phage lysozyme)